MSKCRHVMEFDNIETVKRAVEIEAGISIVPQGTDHAGSGEANFGRGEDREGWNSSPARGDLQEEQSALAGDEAVFVDFEGVVDSKNLSSASAMSNFRPWRKFDTSWRLSDGGAGAITCALERRSPEYRRSVEFSAGRVER